MLEKLLCATDGSKASEKAVSFACDMANKVGAELTFVVVDMITNEKLSGSKGWSSVMLEAVDEQENKELHLAEKTARDKGVKTFSSASAHGDNIANAVVSFAEEHGFEHIVVGSTGKTGITRVLIGSVAADIVAKAHCPVTVVR